MPQIEITIKYTPLGGSRRVTFNVLSEKDTTLDERRIGEVVGMNIERAARLAYGFGEALGRYRVRLINGETLTNVRFDGFYTVRELHALGGPQLNTYARLAYPGEDRSEITQSVRPENILSVEEA